MSNSEDKLRSILEVKKEFARKLYIDHDVPFRLYEKFISPTLGAQGTPKALPSVANQKMKFLYTTKELLRQALGISTSTPFSAYPSYIAEKPWSPRHPFTLGEEGLWYDPSDISTLFQDVTGRVPVTKSGDPVGLILDKSSEGVFPVQQVPFGEDSWTLHNAGSIFTGNNIYSPVTGAAYISGITTIGKTYLVTVEYSSLVLTKGSLELKDSSTSTGASPDILRFSSAGRSTGVYTAVSTGFYLRFSASGSVTIDSFVLQEVSPNYAYQEISSRRPTFISEGGLSWLDFDGIDDFLTVNSYQLPATTDFSSYLSFELSSKALPSENGIMSQYSSSIDGGNGRSILRINVPKGKLDFFIGGLATSNLDFEPSDVLRLIRSNNIFLLSTSLGETTLNTPQAVQSTAILIGSTAQTASRYKGKIFSVWVKTGKISKAAETRLLSYLNKVKGT